MEQLPPITADTVRDERVAELVSYIGNWERKCVLQLLVDKGETVRAEELRQRFAAAQEPQGVVSYSRHGTALLLQSSHAHVGALTLLTPDESPAAAEYYKSPALPLPDAVAGHHLGMAAKHGVVLGRWLGDTKIPFDSLRGPAAMLCFAGYFADRPAYTPATLYTLASATDVLFHTVHTQAERLGSHGYVSYNPGAPWYRTIPGVNPYISRLTLDGKVRRRASPSHHGESSYRVEVGMVVAELMDDGIQTFTSADVVAGFARIPGLRAVVNPALVARALRSMAVERMVEQVVLPETDEAHMAQVWCSPGQKKKMDHLARVYRGLRERNDGVIDEGIEIGTEVLRDKTLVRELLYESWIAASEPRRASFEDRAAIVTQALTGREVSTTFMHRHYFSDERPLGVRLTKGSLMRILERMRDAGTIESRIVRGENVWRLYDD